MDYRNSNMDAATVVPEPQSDFDSGLPRTLKAQASNEDTEEIQ
jgi:hypothetical protein